VAQHISADMESRVNTYASRNTQRAAATLSLTDAAASAAISVVCGSNKKTPPTEGVSRRGL